MLTFHIAAPPDSAVAQRVQLALALHGVGVTVGPAATRPHLTVGCAGRGKLVLGDSLAMLELIDRLFAPRSAGNPAGRAARRQIVDQVLLAEDRLAAVIAARDGRDLDLAVYHLRESLRRIENGLAALPPTAPAGPGLLDCALAPLLWRLQVLDRRFAARLGVGLPGLHALAVRLLALPQVAAVLNRAAADRLVSHLRDSGAALADAEVWTIWDRAFAPQRAENKVLFAGQRTKVPSIGRSGAFR